EPLLMLMRSVWASSPSNASTACTPLLCLSLSEKDRVMLFAGVICPIAEPVTATVAVPQVASNSGPLSLDGARLSPTRLPAFSRQPSEPPTGSVTISPDTAPEEHLLPDISQPVNLSDAPVRMLVPE